MAVITLNFESEYLSGNTKIHVILPNLPRNREPEAFYRPDRKFKVLWLLHGTFGDASDWLRHSRIELFACEKELAVVMPSALNSAYVNWTTFARGFFMEDFLIRELMPLVYNWFPVSDRREDNFVAGLSMGGEGAMQFAVNYPDRFAAVACLSASARDYEKLLAEQPDKPRFQNMIQNAGSRDALLKSTFNVRRTLGDLSRKGGLEKLPRMYAACGTRDAGYEGFLDFLRFAQGIGLPVQTDVLPGYAHEWRFWDIEIEKSLSFFGLKNIGEE